MAKRGPELETEPATRWGNLSLIQADNDPGADEWLEYNREMSEIWPNITMKIDPLPDYEKYTDEEGKFQKYGSKKPGTI